MTRMQYLQYRAEFMEDLANLRLGAMNGVFDSKLMDKLEKGYEEYGDSSYALDQKTLMTEVQSEALDIPGWLSIIYGKLRSEGVQRKDLDKIMELAALGVDAYYMAERIKNKCE